MSSCRFANKHTHQFTFTSTSTHAGLNWASHNMCRLTNARRMLNNMESTDRLGHETNHSDLQNKCNKHIPIELRTDKLTPFDDAASLSECVMLCSSVFEAKRQQCNYLKSICCTCNKSQYVIHTLVSIFSTSLKNIH